MSSFYGNYSTGGGGGAGGTSNYNELSNKPIINLNGAENNPIVFNTLSIGTYLIKGRYKYTKDDQIKNTDLLLLNVFIDSINNKKVCKFEKSNNDIWFLYIISLTEDNNYIENVFPIEKPSYNILFITQLELPEVGEENTLYVTDKYIYQWKNERYIELGFPQESLKITIDLNEELNGDKKYTVKQGIEKIGEIDIKKDVQVASGIITNINEKGEEGTFVELTLNDEKSSKIYIDVKTLVDIYFPAEEASEVKLYVNRKETGTEISADLVDDGVSESKLSPDIRKKFENINNALTWHKIN